MISIQELDSLPFSEASPDAIARKLNPRPKSANYPDWKLCGKHGIWFLFQCARCSGDLMPYGAL